MAKKPKRPLLKVIDNMRQVRKIRHVDDANAVTKHGSADGKHTNQIRLAVWNLWKGSGGDKFASEFRAIAEQADFLVCQEALLTPQALELFRMDGFECVHAAAYIRADGHRDGVLTASRLKSQGDGQRILGKFPEPVFKTPKTALVTRHPIIGTDKSIMIVNIHARLIRRIENAMDEILHVIEQLPEHDGPVIFAGDFNTFTPGYLRIITKVLKSHGLIHVPIPEDPRSTLGALDQVFVKNLHVTDIRVDTTIEGSDHFPILLRAEIGKAS